MHTADEVFDHFARVASALGSPTRLKLIDRLCQGDQTVDQLAVSVGVSISNASRQLRLLADAGLVVAERRPPYVRYRVADERVLEFWFALRDLARTRLAEVDRAVAAFLAGTDSMTPMSRSELLNRMETGEVTVLDVRPATEYRAGHLPAAISIPLEELEARLAELSEQQLVVAYCRGPYCVLSAQAVRTLRDHGREAVRLEDGLPEWKAAGLPVQVGGSR
jgi:ArsR family transcriptional regulator